MDNEEKPRKCGCEVGLVQDARVAKEMSIKSQMKYIMICYYE